MIIFIRSKHLDRLEQIMSAFLDDFRTALNQVAQGGPDDAETQQAVAALQAQIDANDSVDEEMKTAIMELVNRLAASTPPLAAGSADGTTAGTDTGTGDGAAA